MAYTDQATLAADSVFRGRVKIALVTAARTLLQQAQGPSELSSTVQSRRQLALSILHDPNLLIETATWALASIPSITGASTDSTIQNTVNQVLAGLIS